MTFLPSKFFDVCRNGIMGPSLDNDEVSGADAILSAMKGLPVAWVAYALATAWHETAHTMQPVKEYGGANYFFRRYDIQGQKPALARQLGNTTPGDGVKYAGRGYVQLTGRSNYFKASAKLGVDLVSSPDLAMRGDIAAAIMRQGMREGWFTGKSFQSYLPATGVAAKPQFIAARRIINGTDKASLIADYAIQFQAALTAGGWET
ncbi:MAG: glycoside hydrolase family 19 protein [Shewanella sp.]